MVYKAINSYPPRFTRVWPAAGPADTYRAEGTYRAWLQCLALAVGGHYPLGSASPEDTAAWRAMLDALDEVLSQAAATLDDPDYDAALRAVHAAAAVHGLAPPRPAPRPMSMQERILGALTEVGQRAGCQVSIQPQFANTGRVYYTAGTTFTTLVELSYDFQTDYCGLRFHGPAIEALGLHDSPPQFRYQHTVHGWQLGYHMLRYADGAGITAMLDLLTRALTAGPKQS